LHQKLFPSSKPAVSPMSLPPWPEPFDGAPSMIHNLAFQGNYPLALAPSLGIPAHLLKPDGCEYWGKLIGAYHALCAAPARALFDAAAARDREDAGLAAARLPQRATA